VTIKIAFLCLAHNNFELLPYLSQYYSSNNDDFFLHIDKKIDIKQVKNLHRNSIVLDSDQRNRTRWGTFNIVSATLALLEKAMAHAHYDHFILVSGADIPLLTKVDLKQKLCADLSYMSLWQTITPDQKIPASHEFFHRHYYNSHLTNPGEAYLTKNKLRIYAMLIANKLIALMPRNIDFNFPTYVKGSQWWSITHELATYLVAEMRKENNISEFSAMHAPDEKALQTIAFNSPYANKINFDQSQESLKQGLHYIDWGLKLAKPALQKFSVTQVNHAKQFNCAFARKVVHNDIESFIPHLKAITT
jgi:hypothetical protein